MQYDNYISRYSKANKQHNIMVLVGNGFDIDVLHRYRNDKVDSTYSKFYDFVEYIGYSNTNLLIKKMKEAKKNNNKNWSDFEALIPQVLQNQKDCDIVNNSLIELQEKFSLFLNQVVTPEIENNLGYDSQTNRWATRSLSNFLADLSKNDFKNLKFYSSIWHYQVYNFLFVNFNYTSLLDDYIYLDKNQFNPHQYKTTDTNFTFYPNPFNYPNLSNKFDSLRGKLMFSGYVHSRVIHPHGYQHIPRSLLFGASADKFKGDNELRKFNKEYWTQYDVNYKSLFSKTSLFIIYGSSMGESDKWWWNKICDALAENESAELIIYSYNDPKFNAQKFADSYAGNNVNKDKIIKKIYVITYNDTTNLNFLSLKEN